MKIIKARGQSEPYDPEKVKRSLKRAGAPSELVEQILLELSKELREGTTTKTLYKIVFKKLKRLSRTVAGKYHLKKAIMELGPTGFPFEKFVAALLEAEGYRTLTNQLIQGHCVKHEIDVIADKGDSHFIMECKYHSRPGSVCDIKVALYVYARFLDLGLEDRQMWLVTNTRLSQDAKHYVTCMGMGFMSWNEPAGNSLRERIDRLRLYPVTCLLTLSAQEKQKLLKKNIVLCSMLSLEVLEGIVLEKDKVMEEVRALCNSHS